MLPTFYQTHLQKQLTQAPFILLTILLNVIQSEKQVRLERRSASISLPNYYRKPPSQLTKIYRFTSINELTNLVPINQLLVNNLLPYRTKVIDGDRSYVSGVYQSVHNRFNLAATHPSHYTGHCYPN